LQSDSDQGRHLKKSLKKLTQINPPFLCFSNL